MTALRRLSLRKRIPLQAHRLQHSLLPAKLRRLHRRRVRFSHRIRSARRHQNPNTEQKLRKQGKRVPDCQEHGEDRGLHELLQGIDAQVADDGAKTRL